MDNNNKDASQTTNVSDITSTEDEVSGEFQSASGLVGFIGTVYETVRTRIVPKAVQFVSTQVAPRTLYIMKTLLQDVPVDVSFSDSDDDWEGCKLEESDDSDDKEDIKGQGEQPNVSDLPIRKRIYNICHELITTEETYVRRLGILVMVKQRTEKIINSDVANSMFKDIEVIHQFHKENLLPQLQKRLQDWNKHQCIGDIMKKLTPFLKLYTEYVKNFEVATSLVETWEEKSSSFSKLLKEVREDKKLGRLRLQAHMLEPIQRVPRYQLLLSDYLKRIPEDSTDRDDTTRALEQVSAAAKHFEDTMRRDTRILKLVEFQNMFEGSINIVTTSREFIKQGRVKTISAKNNKSVDRMCFLFNDLLLIAERTPSRLSTKYKAKHIIDIASAQLADGNNIDIPHTFYIKTKDTVIEICLKDEEEKLEWEKAIMTQIGDCTKRKLLRRGSVRVKNADVERRILGRRAPVLIHQNSISTCMICNSVFGTLKKKKHCRACGHVICTKCSRHTCFLHYDLSKPLRICDECFVILGDNSHEFNKCGKTNKVQGECMERGYLQLSSDGGKTWKRRWFALHSNLVLYSFRTKQDAQPLTSMSLYGYSVSFEVSPIKRGSCIRLQGMGKIYLLYDADSTLIQSWYDTLTRIVQKLTKNYMTISGSAESLTSSQDNERLNIGGEDTATATAENPDTSM